MDSRGMDVRVLQTMLNTVGADLLVDGIFGNRTWHTVCDFQSVKGLEPDGIVGPKTWNALDGALARLKYEAEHPKAPAPVARKTDEDLRKAGEKAVERALSMWALDIYDPKQDDYSDAAGTSAGHIVDMIHSGLGWTWVGYAGDGDFEWCGAFAATCWMDIKASLRKDYYSSTYRLDRYASYRSAFGEEPDARPADGERLRAAVDGLDFRRFFDPRPGDILLVGKKGYGTHICLVESYDAAAGAFCTVEGNAFGNGPHGEYQQGVIRRTRGLKEIRRIIRPGVDDLR
jgi:hypothetical protein